MPAFGPKQCGDPPIAIAAVVAGKPHHRFRQGFFIVSSNGMAPLHRAMLTENPAGEPLRDTKTLLGMDHTLAAAFGA